MTATYDDPSVLYDSPSVLYDDGAPPVLFAIEIAFTTTDPLTASPAWTDVTPWVRSFSTRRGRNHELGRTGAGTATIILDNRDRRFDPTYTGLGGFGDGLFGDSMFAGSAVSPYQPNVLPMKQVRIRSISPSVSDVFRGFAEDWGQGWAGPAAPTLGDATVPLQAVDGFKVLQLAQLRTYRAEVLKDAPVVYVPFDDPVSSATATNLGSAGGEFFYGLETAMPGRTDSPIANGVRRSLDVAPETALTPRSLSLITSSAGVCQMVPLTVEAWVYLDALPSGANATPIINLGSAAFGYISSNYIEISTTGHVVWHGPGQGAGSSLTSVGTLSLGTWHHVVCTADARSTEAPVHGGFGIYIDGAVDSSTYVETLFTSGFVDATWYTGDNGPFDGAQAHLAFYDYVLPPERIAAHYAATNIDRIEGSGGAAIGELLEAVGWSTLRDVDAGVSDVTLAPEGAALDLMQSVGEDTEHGILEITPDGKATFIDRQALAVAVAPLATFGDGGGAEIPYADLVLSYDDQDLWTEVGVSGTDITEVVVSDASAVTSFGTRTLSVQTVATFATEVASQANGLLNRYKAPAVRPVSMTLIGPRAIDQQLRRKVGDRVQIRRRPPGGGTLTVDAIIEGIDHNLGPDGWPVTTFQLAPPDVTSWILEDATYGLLGTTTIVGW